MGTTYSVKLGPSHLSERKARELQADVEHLLADITRQMSTYDPTTDISRFNAHTGTDAVTVAACGGHWGRAHDGRPVRRRLRPHHQAPGRMLGLLPPGPRR